MHKSTTAFLSWIRQPGVWLRILIAALLLLFLFKFFASLPRTLKLIVTAHPGYLLLGLAVVTFGELVTVVKWQQLMRCVGKHLPFVLGSKGTLIGMFYNNILPGSVGGDVARMFIVAPYVGGKSSAAAGIFMQRNTGMAGLLIVGNLACCFWPEPIPSNDSSIPRLLMYPATWMVAVTVGFIVANILIVHDGLSRWISGHVGGWRHKGRSRFHRNLIRVAIALVHLHDDVRGYYRRLVLPSLVSILSQIIDCTLVYVITLSLGLDIPYQLFLIFVPLVTVATMIPISFNGLGLREAGYLLLLGSYGVNKEAVVATSLMHYGFMLFLSFGGLIWHIADLTAAGSEASSPVEVEREEEHAL